MSNLGSIYYINAKTGRKEKYSVVYRNKTFFYVKVHGTDQLIYFKELPEQFKTDYRFYVPGPYFISLSDYLHIKNRHPDRFNDFSGAVYVPCHRKYDFPELSNASKKEKIKRNKQKIDEIKRNIKSLEEKINYLQNEELIRYQETLDRLIKENIRLLEENVTENL